MQQRLIASVTKIDGICHYIVILIASFGLFHVPSATSGCSSNYVITVIVIIKVTVSFSTFTIKLPACFSESYIYKNSIYNLYS